MTEPASPDAAGGAGPSPLPRRERDQGGIVAGLVLIAIGALLLAAQTVPDVGEYIVLAIGLVLFVLFLTRRQYGLLIPACILTGLGIGVPLATANPGELGGGLVMVCLASGFLAIWILGALFRLRENHWWPLIPGAILGVIGGALVAGERGQPLAETVATLWPLVFLVAGAVLIGQELLRPRSR